MHVHVRSAWRTASAVTFIQVVVGVLWLIELGLDPVEQLAEIPRWMREPVGALAWLPAPAREAFFSAPGLLALKLTTMASLGAALLACRHRALRAGAWVSAALGLTVYQSIVRSFGSRNHGEIVALLSVYLIAAAAWRTARAGAAARGAGGSALPREDEAWVVFPMQVVLLMTYCLVGATRLTLEFPEAFSPQTLRYYVSTLAYEQSFHGHTWGRLVNEWPLVAGPLAAGCFIVTVFEALAPLVVVSRRFRLLWVAVAIGFHLFGWLAMNIFFWENLVLIVLLFVVIPSGARARRGAAGTDSRADLSHGAVDLTHVA